MPVLKIIYTERRSFAKAMVLILSLSGLVLQFSCKKMVNVTPPSTSINSGNVFSNDETAIAAVTDLYVNIASKSLKQGGITSLSLFPALSADELSLYTGATNNSVFYFYTNSLSSANLNNPDLWVSFYEIIYLCNSSIEGLQNSSTLTSSVKNQLLGECKFLRAFCYFYSVNSYGDVPLALGTDYSVNGTLPRTSKNNVDNQIISDLKDAQSLLSPNFLDATLLSSTTERVRPTKWAATAMLAREYLFVKDFIDAKTQADGVISNISLFNLTSLDDVFLKNSNEAIWQLQPVNAGWNTEYAKTFIIPSSGPNSTSYPFYLSHQLLDAFEANDQRKQKWLNNVSLGNNSYYYSYKYKSATYNAPVTEYEMVLRLAEQYLIRSEAEAQLDQTNEAKNDLNVIRMRAGLSATNPSDKKSLLTAILHERQVELFTEWGHRWFDLKRTGNVDAVMSIVTPMKGGIWNTNWQWYPISRTELLLDPNLVQNPGY